MDSSLNSKGRDGYVEGDGIDHVSFRGNGAFIADIKRLTQVDGGINLRPLPGNSSKYVVNLGYYSGHNLLANGKEKSNSNWVINCKKWEYTGELGVTSPLFEVCNFKMI